MDDNDKNTLMWYFEIEDFKRVIEYCNSLLDINELDYRSLGARGRAFNGINDFEHALVDLAKSIALCPHYSVAYEQRGIANFSTGKYQEAINDFLKFTELSGECADNFYLGLAYYYVENYIEAIRCLNDVLSEFPNSFAYNIRAQCHYAQGDYKLGLHDIVECLKNENDELKSLTRIKEINRIKCSDSEDDDGFTKLQANELILNLGFSEISSPISEISAIYIIEFCDDEYYVGQSRRLSTRINQHKEKHSNIKRIFFKICDNGSLIDLETQTIHRFELNLIRIRNTKQIKFSNIFSYDKQLKWINDRNYKYISGSRYSSENDRTQFASRYLELAKCSYYHVMVCFLKKYISAFIPNAVASEYTYWSITCFPKHLKEDKCISRVNINGIPVLSLYYESEELKVMIFMSRQFILSLIVDNVDVDDALSEIPSLRIDVRDGFKNSDNDEITIFIGEQDLDKIFANNVIFDSIRIYNLRMMNCCGNESGFRRRVSHCLDLADAIMPNSVNLRDEAYHA